MARILSTKTVFKIYVLNQWKTIFFLSGELEGPRYADVFVVTEDITLSDYDALLEETQVRNECKNMSYE